MAMAMAGIVKWDGGDENVKIRDNILFSDDLFHCFSDLRGLPDLPGL